ncbi:MAG: hypothetical protein NDI94_01605 [Candidatus Woesearchaeota archaeon]|nr:hypothetical protein [Candidatus Woesearchaeota archaeon]
MYLDRFLEKIKDATFAVSQDIHEKGYDVVVVSGYSGMFSTQLLKSGYARLGYQHMPLLLDLKDEGNKIIYKEKMVYEERVVAAGRYLKENFPGLYDSTPCYLDDHANQGAKIKLLKQFFPDFGLPDFSFYVFTAYEDKYSFLLPKDTFVGIRNTAVTYNVKCIAEDLGSIFQLSEDNARRDIMRISDYILGRYTPIDADEES